LPTTVDGHSRDPDVDHEDPDLVLLASDDRSDLIGLELHYSAWSSTMERLLFFDD